MSQVSIREFTVGDYESLYELWKQAGLVIRPGDDRDGVILKLQRDPDLFLVAMQGRELVGSVMGGWDGRRGWIYHLAVKPSHRRQGIATILLDELERRLAKKGARKVNAQIYRSNTTSLRFFDASGYEIHSDLVMIGKALKD